MTELRETQINVCSIIDVQPDGDGDWTVHLAHGAWMTIHPDDLPRPPRVGDRILVQVPIAIGFAGEDPCPS